ncbi:MAG: biopolymer transporter ExbD [Acidobacteria bacterium]|nr:biopolymer transporter ExbD [Acidobacteriota bacterium]
MGMKVGGGKGEMSEPNVVPFIDILLVLIIIFMVITPLIPKGLDALVPQPPPPGTETREDVLQRTVVIQVLAVGGRIAVKINQDDVTWDMLGPRLNEIFKTRAEKIAFVKGDDVLEFHEVARAIDIAKMSGVEKIGLITAKIEKGQ